VSHLARGSPLTCAAHARRRRLFYLAAGSLATSVLALAARRPSLHPFLQSRLVAVHSHSSQASL